MLEDKDIGFILHRADMSAKCNFSNKLNELGITPGQFTVLKEIYYYQKEKGDLGLAPACIAARLGSDRPTISGILDRLEAQGWTKRLLNPQDKRSCLIRVTDKAIEEIKALEKICYENGNTILKGFTQEETAAFRNYLLRVINNFIDS